MIDPNYAGLAKETSVARMREKLVSEHILKGNKDTRTLNRV